MKYQYTIIGAGRQGVALAYDLACAGEAARVVLIDTDHSAAEAAARRLRELLRDTACEFQSLRCDAADPAALAAVLPGADVVVSAAPYRFNVALTDAALAAGACFCDLGGNTDVVRAQLERHADAVQRGISIVPDCGLAPGLGNHLAAHGIAALDEPETVHIRCGGLPQQPVGPLGYKLVFNFDGLINEYSGLAEFLRAGRKIEVPALEELESLDWPGIGPLEAAVTSGGTSTCPTTYLGKLRDYDYKTIRYPGHFAVIRAMFGLGCFESRVTLADGTVLEPRALLRRLMETRLDFPDQPDLVLLRVTVCGRQAGQPRTLRYSLYDRHDPATGFTAMERTTAFPAALVAHMQARRLIAPGARPLEIAVPPRTYVEELPAHGITVVQESTA